MIDEVAKGSPPKLSPSAQHSKQVRTSQSSSSSQVHKGRSRSSSSASSGKGLLERNSERYKKDRSPSARSRLDKHLEEYSPQDEKRRKARRNSRASTEQAQASTQLPTKSDEGRHRTWSGPEESKGREKGRSIDIEAQSLWSDGTGGSTALNTRGSRTSTSTSKDSRRSPSTFSARMLGGSKSSTADSPRKSPRAISREDAVILVDWDDTLCPTSWVFEQIRRCPDNKALAAVEKSSGPLLDEHSKAVVAFLRAAHACAQVAVVTLATEEFFHQSATTFLENVRVSDLFKELGIEVHFAERPSQMSFPAEIDAKKKASFREDATGKDQPPEEPERRRGEQRKPRVDCWRGDGGRRSLGREDADAARAQSAAPAPRRASKMAGDAAGEMPASSVPQGSSTPSAGRATSVSAKPPWRASGSVPAPKKEAARRSSKGKGKGLPPKADLDEHEKALLNEVLQTSPGVSWDTIAGLEEVKRLFWEIVVAPVKNPKLFTGVRSPPRGVLLFGPPGNGKTMLAKAVASECNATFFSISASSLVSKGLGDSEKHMRALFSVAGKMQPSVIFMDEIDSIWMVPEPAKAHGSWCWVPQTGLVSSMMQCCGVCHGASSFHYQTLPHEGSW
eukprot:symbB.v1.2.017654.t1/scaffold1373.1/size231899/19